MLKVDRVSIHFAGAGGQVVHALDRASLEIPEHGLVVALGASGCGKTSLLNAIAGFLPVSSGTITLNGQPITKPGADRGVVFQKDTLLPWKTVADNVALGLKFAGVSRSERRDRADELLGLVGLEAFAKSFPYELSGGMRQRAGIARALATDPEILLMDEPFGALDSLTRETMQELLVRVWHQTGKRIFLITHSIDEALLLGREVVVMSPRPGRIVARIPLDFVDDFAREGTTHAAKSRPEFAERGEELRALIHGTERRGIAA